MRDGRAIARRAASRAPRSERVALIAARVLGSSSAVEQVGEQVEADEDDADDDVPPSTAFMSALSSESVM